VNVRLTVLTTVVVIAVLLWLVWSRNLIVR
jgi:hypothetical protein